MPVHWYNATITDILEASPRTRRIFLDTGVDQFSFLPGQFITADLPLGEKRRDRWRSYSIASAPDNGSKIELCVGYLETGLASNYLFNNINIGDTLKLKGPDGGFVLPDQLESQDLVLICTGTGVAPFRSMILTLFEQNIPHRNVHLIFGSRYAHDLIYREEFEQLAGQHTSFTYDPILSRELLNGRKGYVHEVYKKAYAQKRADVKFMVCGWSEMIDETVANLIATMGYDKSQVSYELYG